MHVIDRSWSHTANQLIPSKNYVTSPVLTNILVASRYRTHYIPLLVPTYENMLYVIEWVDTAEVTDAGRLVVLLTVIYR